MRSWFAGLGISRTRRGRSIIVALATSFAILSVPGAAHAQRVAPTGVASPKQLSVDSPTAARQEDPRDRCRRRHIVRNAVLGGLTALVIVKGMPFAADHVESPAAPLLGIGIGAGIGAAYGNYMAHRHCTLRPR